MATRRDFLQAALGAGMAAHTGAMQAQSPGPQKVNIVYIHTHDSGRYLSPYGHNVPTPNLQKLAEQGVVFRGMFTAAPTCSPSRAALLTGQCPHSNGMLGLAHLGWGLNNNYKHHIVHTLRAQGYETVLAGLQHVAGHDPSVIGYDKILEHPNNHAAVVVPGAIKYILEKHDKPFFIDIGFTETHRPYAAPTAADNANYIVPPSPIPDTPMTRADMAAYHSSARNFDKGLGAVMEAIEKAGIAGNTLVISTTDHGIAMPSMKCNLNDGGMGISFILRGPRDLKAGSVCDAMLSNIDVFPTICDYIGAPIPAWVEGKSFLPVLRGASPEVNEEIFSEVTYHAAYEPKRAVRTKRYKYIKRFDGRTLTVLPNCDDGLSKTVWLNAGWQKNPIEHEEELYDLIFDPAERNNLIADHNHAAAATEMRSRLQSWMKRTSDPLLKGPVALPPNGVAEDPNSISPMGATRRAERMRDKRSGNSTQPE